MAKNKAGTLTEYEKEGWILTRTFLALFVLSVLVGVLVFVYEVYLWDIYLELALLLFNSSSQTIIYSERLTFFPLYCYNIVYNICDEAE